MYFISAKRNAHFYLMLVLSYFAIVMAQWVHFVYYFNQQAARSFVWSVTDWMVWFSIALLCFYYCQRMTSNQHKKVLIIAIAFTLLAGPAQIILSSSIYQIIYTADKSLAESFFHLMNKRWLQNLFIGCIFSLIGYHLLSSRKTIPPEARQSNKVQQDQQLSFYDGKSHHKVQATEIEAVTSTKNYLSIFLGNKEIVIRATLKSVLDELPQNEFIKVSRSTIINKESIAELTKYSRSSYKLVLTNGLEVKVSKSCLTDVQNLLRPSLQLSQPQQHSSLSL